MTVFSAVAIGSANIETLLVMLSRGALFGASTQTNSGAVITDMFNASERGLAAARWLSGSRHRARRLGLRGASRGVAVGLDRHRRLQRRHVDSVLALGPETYAPVLLQKRAAKLPMLTRRVYVSKMDLDKPCRPPLPRASNLY